MDEKSKALAEKYFPLAISTARKYDSNEYELDDLVGICSLALCRAAQVFDESRQIMFSTLAIKYMQNALLKEFSRNKQRKFKKKYGVSRSLNSPLHDAYENEISLLETIGGKDLRFDLIDADDQLAQADPKWIQARILYHIYGYTQHEVAKIMGIAQMTVSRYVQKPIEKALQKGAS